MFLSDLAALIDGDPAARERHQELLNSNEAARSLHDEMTELAARLGNLGEDFRSSVSFEDDLALALVQVEQRRAAQTATSLTTPYLSSGDDAPPQAASNPQSPQQTASGATGQTPEPAPQIAVLRLDESPQPPSPTAADKGARTSKHASKPVRSQTGRKVLLWSTALALALGVAAVAGALHLNTIQQWLPSEQARALERLRPQAELVQRWTPVVERKVQSWVGTAIKLGSQGLQHLGLGPQTSDPEPLPLRPQLPQPGETVAAGPALPIQALPEGSSSQPGALVLEPTQGNRLPNTAAPQHDSTATDRPNLTPGLSLRTDGRTVAQLGRPGAAQLRLGRSSRLQRAANTPLELHLQGDLSYDSAGSPPDAPFELHTQQCRMQLQRGLVAIHAGPLETRIAVLRGSIAVEPNQHPARRVEVGEVLRIPQRGAITTADVVANQDVFETFQNPGSLGTIGTLRPLLTAPWTALVAPTTSPDPNQAPTADTLASPPSPWPTSHSVELQLSGDQALIQVTERFPGSPQPQLVEYTLPLPHNGQLISVHVEGEAAEAENGPPPEREAFTQAQRRSDSPSAPIGQVVRQLPISRTDQPLQITTRYLQPVAWDGVRPYLRYHVEPPLAGLEHPLHFTGTAQLEEPGRLSSGAPYSKSERGNRTLHASLDVPQTGLHWTIYIKAKVPETDGRVRYSALAPATSPPPATTRDPATRSVLNGPGLGMLYLAPALPQPPRSAQHWVAVIDRSFSMRGLAMQLVPQVLRQMAQTARPDDRFSVLACDLHCELLTDHPEPPLQDPTDPFWARLSAIQTGAAFDLGHALTEASALGNGSNAPAQLHMVVFTNGRGSAGRLDPTQALQLALGGRQPPSVSVVQLQAGLSPQPGLDELARTLNGQVQLVQSSTSAQATGFALTRPDQAIALVQPTLTLQRAGRPLNTEPLPNLVLDTRLRHPLPPRAQPADQAILSGHIGGMPFEKLYPLPPPPPTLEVTPQSHWWQHTRKPTPPERHSASSRLQGPSLKAALQAYDEARNAAGLATDSPEPLELTALADPTQPHITWPPATDAPLERTRTAFQANPSNRQTLRAYVQAVCHGGRPTRCVELSHAIADLAPEFYLDDVPLALLRLGRQEAAIEALTQLADLRPNDAQLHARVGLLQQALGHTERACSHLQRASELSKDSAEYDRARACWAELHGTADPGEVLPPSPAPQPEPTPLALQVDASWQGGDDYDLALVDHRGNAVSLLDGDERIEGPFAEGRESLLLPELAPGIYQLEILARDPFPPTPNSPAPAATDAETPEPEPPLQVTVRAQEATLNLVLRPTAKRTAVARLVLRPNASDVTTTKSSRRR